MADRQLAVRCGPSDELIRESMITRRLILSDAESAARVYRASYDDRLPWLAGRHTPDEDRAFFADVVFDKCEAWGSFDGDALAGFIAFRDRWIDQLYVLPAYQGCGIGGGLLALAQVRFRELQLWTFEKNDGARRFYEHKGFAIAEWADGLGNDEHEPHVRYIWCRK